MSEPFIAIEAEADAASLEQEVYEALEAQFGEWSPAEGGLATWLTKAFARIGAGVFEQATAMSTSAFQKFGETVVGVPPIQAAPATAESTWTMVDEAGYTIPAGTQVRIEKDGETALGFEVTENVVVPPGEDEATVPLAAIEPGEEANGLSADPKLEDALAYVSAIALVGETANGVDEEEEDAYLNRLVATLQLLSLDLVVGRDFEIDALAVAGIHRSLAIEAYNSDESKAEALAVSVWGIDEDGADPSAEKLAELKERQEAKVPSGVNVYAAKPSRQKVKVKAQFTVLSGFDPEVVETAVKAAIDDYLASKNWGLPTQGDASTSGGWINRTTVYRFELVSLVDRVAGVDRVSLLELAKEGSGFGTADVAMTGKVTLTESGGAHVVEAV